MTKKKIETNFLKLTSRQEHELLEMYHHCNALQGLAVTDDLKTIESNGMLSLTNIHWYQLMMDFIFPTLLEGLMYWKDVFCRVCLQNKAEHPVDWLYRAYQKRKAGVSLFAEIPQPTTVAKEEKTSKKSAKDHDAKGGKPVRKKKQ